jgi:hypothetical protein
MPGGILYGGHAAATQRKVQLAMRAEIETMVDAIEQSVGLLRRHL